MSSCAPPLLDEELADGGDALLATLLDAAPFDAVLLHHVADADFSCESENGVGFQWGEDLADVVNDVGQHALSEVFLEQLVGIRHDFVDVLLVELDVEATLSVALHLPPRAQVDEVDEDALLCVELDDVIEEADAHRLRDVVDVSVAKLLIACGTAHEGNEELLDGLEHLDSVVAGRLGTRWALLTTRTGLSGGWRWGKAAAVLGRHGDSRSGGAPPFRISPREIA